MARKRQKAPATHRHEAKWLACQDPCELLEMVKRRVNVRKMRLVGVACCRRISKLFHADACHRGVEVAERYADGLAGADELFEAHRAVGTLEEDGRSLGGQATAWRNRTACMSAFTVYEVLVTNERLLLDGGSTVPYRAADAAFEAAYEAFETWDDAASEAGTAAQDAEAVAQVALVRDVLGNPFQPVSLNPSWLSWDGGLVVRLARTIYEERAFDRLPILADALEEAGCDNPDVLSHCREGSVHVRGCWVLDLCLGKQ
jgi:hypothetical protein